MKNSPREAQNSAITGLSLIADGNFVESHHHLANETVLLEGQTMSGRKGITVSADEVIAEAKSRALAVTKSLNPNLKNPEIISSQVGLGALKFAFLKANRNAKLISVGIRRSRCKAIPQSSCNTRTLEHEALHAKPPKLE